jgi:actin related protein 2/3 complex subunit 1A/1B
MSQVIELTEGEGNVTCHAWNADRSKVAFCPLNSSNVEIWKKVGTGFEREFVLSEHDHTVTGIDWGHKTNRLVTCSQDRNAYVWTFDKASNKWNPTLVILRLDRGCTQVKFSPDETKFAVGSAVKIVSICYFEEEHDWWVSKHIKKHHSTVLSISWAPDNVLLATGSTDYRARIVSTFLKNIDQAPNTAFGDEATKFGEVLGMYEANSWVHDVAFSPSGARLAFVSHDSSCNFIEVSEGAQAQVTKVKFDGLPLRSLQWLHENAVVAAGHDCSPKIFVNQGGWKFLCDVDGAAAAAAGGAAKPGAKAGGGAMDMFKNMDKLGTQSVSTALNTKHQNSISCVQIVAQAGGKVTKFSTSGMDGTLVIWDSKW